MENTRRTFHKILLAGSGALSLGLLGTDAKADSAQELDAQAALALQNLYKTRPVAETLSKTAKAILIFPKIIKAGLVFGGSYGEGVMTKANKPAGYFNSVSASWCWQAGSESYGYAVFLMSDKALRYVETSKGWEVGVGPSVVVVTEGVAKNLTSSTLRKDAYAFVFDQQGLMASLSIEGTKISRIKR